jgi:ComF family protein
MSFLQTLHCEFSGLLDLFLPPACPLCGVELQTPPLNVLCSECMAGIQPFGSPRCPRCALPYPTEEGTDHLCESCLREEPPFVWIEAVGIYEKTLRQAISRFKYQGAVGLDRPLGHFLAAALDEKRARFRPDLLVPVPLHPSRLKERTYNQSLLLAKVLGHKWRIPVACRLLVRTRQTPPQQGLNAKVRRQNLKGAFALRDALAGERILLIDDVLTTGATARECSRTLLDGGAAKVAVAVLGRARRHQR